MSVFAKKTEMRDNIYFNRLIIAAYRLPFHFVKSQNGFKAIQNTGGLVAAILALSEKFKKTPDPIIRNKIVWTGFIDDVPEGLSAKKIENEYFDIVPVNIDPNLNSLYYGGFCNDLIWPLFHYFPSFCTFNNLYFEAYREANSLLCNKIVKIIKPGDFIWIHDYQLMLLPEMIRKINQDVTIGFFLHIPFPSFELFRLLPKNWRESIINGLLGADMIGFHIHDYTQHFIKAVKRNTGFECRQNVIYSPERLVKADAFPISIDYDKFHTATTNTVVMAEKLKMKKHLADQKLIFSVDRLDYSKGLLLRLKGYETFLEKYPQWHSKVVFNMVVVPSRDSIKRYKKMKKEIESTVGRINGKYSTLVWRPVIYQYKHLTFDELVALYDLSDVGLITPLRDGMNLVAKEYVASQVDNTGVLILSEMAGAASELNEAIIINPSDDLEMADAIYTALEMKIEDKQIRIERMQKRISNYNVFTWAWDFFNQTYELKKQQELMNVHLITKSISNQIYSDYKKSVKRIFFFDYDGTLIAYNRFPELAILDKKVFELIKKLSSDPLNHVVIISGRDKNFLETQFRGANIALVAEHGYFIKKKAGTWETTVETHTEWKKEIMPIFSEYMNRCNGTFIEEKTGCIAWHYRNVDPDFAQVRLHELRDELTEIIRQKTDLEILEGDKVLEIKCGKFDKGLAAKMLMKDTPFDFILAAGDDKTDEFVFKALPQNAYTIRVGLNPSMASFNVPDVPSFIKLLKKIVND